MCVGITTVRVDDNCSHMALVRLVKRNVRFGGSVEPVSAEDIEIKMSVEILSLKNKRP